MNKLILLGLILLCIGFASADCTPDLTCDGYGPCNQDIGAGSVQFCNSTFDNAGCGENYTGDFSEFSFQDCTYYPFTHGNATFHSLKVIPEAHWDFIVPAMNLAGPIYCFDNTCTKSAMILGTYVTSIPGRIAYTSDGWRTYNLVSSLPEDNCTFMGGGPKVINGLSDSIITLLCTNPDSADTLVYYYNSNTHTLTRDSHIIEGIYYWATGSTDGNYTFLYDGVEEFTAMNKDFRYVNPTSSISGNYIADVVVSDSGQYHLAVFSDGTIPPYVSNDYGTNYYEIPYVLDFQQIGTVAAISANGQHMISTSNYGFVFSHDYGSTWNTSYLPFQTNSFPMWSAAVSDDGQTMVVLQRFDTNPPHAIPGFEMFYTLNGGDNWFDTYGNIYSDKAHYYADFKSLTFKPNNNRVLYAGMINVISGNLEMVEITLNASDIIQALPSNDTSSGTSFITDSKGNVVGSVNHGVVMMYNTSSTSPFLSLGHSLEVVGSSVVGPTEQFDLIGWLKGVWHSIFGGN